MKILNGWQRIGIFLSVIWIFSTGPIYYWQQSGTALIKNYSENLTCNNVYNTKEDSPSLKACKELSEWGYKEEIKQIKRDSFILSLLSIPVFWFFTYVLLFVWKWIRKGFNY